MYIAVWVVSFLEFFILSDFKRQQIYLFFLHFTTEKQIHLFSTNGFLFLADVVQKKNSLPVISNATKFNWISAHWEQILPSTEFTIFFMFACNIRIHMRLCIPAASFFYCVWTAKEEKKKCAAVAHLLKYEYL